MKNIKIISAKQREDILKKDHLTREDFRNLSLYNRQVGHKLLGYMEVKDIVVEKGEVVYCHWKMKKINLCNQCNKPMEFVDGELLPVCQEPTCPNCFTNTN